MMVARERIFVRCAATRPSDAASELELPESGGGRYGRLDMSCAVAARMLSWPSWRRATHAA